MVYKEHNLPDAHNGVAIERSILTHKRDILDESLCDKQAIERISVAAFRKWQCADHRCVLRRYIEKMNIVCGQLGGDERLVVSGQG